MLKFATLLLLAGAVLAQRPQRQGLALDRRLNTMEALNRFQSLAVEAMLRVGARRLENSDSPLFAAGGDNRENVEQMIESLRTVLRNVNRRDLDQDTAEELGRMLCKSSSFIKDYGQAFAQIRQCMADTGSMETRHGYYSGHHHGGWNNYRRPGFGSGGFFNGGGFNTGFGGFPNSGSGFGGLPSGPFGDQLANLQALNNLENAFGSNDNINTSQSYLITEMQAQLNNMQNVLNQLATDANNGSAGPTTNNTNPANRMSEEGKAVVGDMVEDFRDFFAILADASGEAGFTQEIRDSLQRLGERAMPRLESVQTYAENCSNPAPPA